jgi:DNA-nicking Smr family endonuclease
MKRSSTPIPELPTPPRRKRSLSEEERALWESVAKQIKPLRKKPRAAKPEAIAPAPVPKPVAFPKPPASAKILRAAKPEVPAAPPLAPLGRRERSQLSRGNRAHHDGLTFVLVITGKGKMGAESERGVLRRQVPHWLSLPEFRSLVVGFEEAHIGHGGEGALYVRIRRARL